MSTSSISVNFNPPVFTSRFCVGALESASEATEASDEALASGCGGCCCCGCCCGDEEVVDEEAATLVVVEVEAPVEGASNADDADDDELVEVELDVVVKYFDSRSESSSDSTAMRGLDPSRVARGDGDGAGMRTIVLRLRFLRRLMRGPGARSELRSSSSEASESWLSSYTISTSLPSSTATMLGSRALM